MEIRSCSPNEVQSEQLRLITFAQLMVAGSAHRRWLIRMLCFLPPQFL
jgi:hypothetical protein